MYKKTVVADLHLHGPHEIKVKLTKDMIGLGDLVDFKNTKNKRKKLLNAKLRIERIYTRILDNAVGGNHELWKKYFPWMQEFYIDEKVIYTHGDAVFWSEEFRNEYYMKHEPGASWFKRKLVSIGSKWRNIKEPEIKDHHLDKAIEMMKIFGRKFMVTGHRHPKDIIYKTRNGYTLICVPRGVTSFYINDDGNVGEVLK